MRTYSEYSVNFLILRENPGDERECAQTCPDVVGKPEDDKGKDGQVREEPISGNRPPIGRDTLLRFVQSSKENSTSQTRRPDKGSWVDQPTAR